MKKLLLIFCVTNISTSLYAMGPMRAIDYIAQQRNPVISKEMPADRVRRCLESAIKRYDTVSARALLEEGVLDVNGEIFFNLPLPDLFEPADPGYFIRVAIINNTSLDLFQVLLDHGADIHINDDDALILATETRHPQIVQWLLDHDANIHTHNEAVLKAIFGYPRRESTLTTYQTLLAAGADINRLSSNEQNRLRRYLQDLFAQEELNLSSSSSSLKQNQY